MNGFSLFVDPILDTLHTLGMYHAWQLRIKLLKVASQLDHLHYVLSEK